MYHDVTEIITGDMPTPVKYYNSEIRTAYKEVEKAAGQEILTGLPENIRKRYNNLLTESQTEKELWIYVKAADKLSALIKCIEERKMGNTDFFKAEQSTLDSIKNMGIAEADYFIEHFIPAYSMTLDESVDIRNIKN